ncbi:MAG: SEC-C metal-binding domain-containing protein [Chloroflexi bacterium]|nr:SEC-C metal-binding domain-containing protein [Chloroflexota bacterium]
MARTNWYSDHPPACTCKSCQERQALHRQHGKIGRNERCPCGSGRKFKRCHGQ